MSSTWIDLAKAAAWKIGKWILIIVGGLIAAYFALKNGLPQ